MLLRHDEMTDLEVRRSIRTGAIRWGGNRRLRTYGRLDCWSGRKLGRANRVFFATERDAREAGYRPCGHCLPDAYHAWREGAKKK